MTDIPAWVQLGVAGLALAALFFGYKRMWVFGWAYRAVEKDRDFWRDMALSLLRSTEKAVTIAESHVTKDA